MNEYIKQYYKIMNEQIEKSFPKLKKIKIVIIEKDKKYRAKAQHMPWGFKITMSKKLRKFPRKSWRRILTHELCHLEIFSEQNWIKTNIEFIFYLLFKKVRKKVEKEANILMIKKGHGKEIMTAMRGNLRRKIPYSLTEREIKYYMKEYKDVKK